MEKIDLGLFDNSGFDRGAPRWKEILWWLLRSLVFATWLPVPSPLRVFILRCFGASVGENVVIRGRVNITFPWRFSCGDDVWLGEEVCILSLAPVSIGSNTCVSQRAFLCTGSHDFTSQTFDLTAEAITIGSHCWVGAQCFIAPGTVFGDQARSLPGAVVTGSVPAGVTVGGVPAEPITTAP